MAKRKLTIASRPSPLAIRQADTVRKLLRAAEPELDCDLLLIKTTGDKLADVDLSQVGGKGLYVKEIEEALLGGAADLAVHSLKDMPAELPPGLVLAGFPEREDPRDVLILRAGSVPAGAPLDALRSGAVVGTTSVRRQAVLRHYRPDLAFVNLRGNVGTRLRKLQDEGLDALVLAAAGLKRLDQEAAISAYLPADWMIPAVGQGCLAVEARADDQKILERLTRITHPETAAAITAERGFLERLGANCQLPVGAHAICRGGTISIQGFISSLDGIGWHVSETTGPDRSAAALGRQLAEELLKAGGQAILAALER